MQLADNGHGHGHGLFILATYHKGQTHMTYEYISNTNAHTQNNRAMGSLMPSRTFGDFSVKKRCPGAVIATPVVTTYALREDDRYVCVCVSVCMHLCIYKYVCACVYVCLYACMYE
jgi:hypothetical protein